MIFFSTRTFKLFSCQPQMHLHLLYGVNRMAAIVFKLQPVADKSTITFFERFVLCSAKLLLIIFTFYYHG